MLQSTLYENALKKWAQVDKENIFNFSSGHLGAIPISDGEISLFLTGRKSKTDIIRLITINILKLLIITIVPVKQLMLFLRTLIRKIMANPKKPSHQLCVLSIGSQDRNADAYFSPLLKAVNAPIMYMKIIGGWTYKNKDYHLVESMLSIKSLIKLFILVFLFTPKVFLYLLLTSRLISNINEKILYIILGMQDLISSAAFNNLLITESVAGYSDSMTAKALLFPMEGRNWEKEVVKNIHFKNGNSIGYVHAAMTPRQKSITSTGFYTLDESPKRIIAPSTMAQKTLEQIFPKSKVDKGYFLRGKMPQETMQSEDFVLFALTGNIVESKKIMDAIANTESPNDKIVIRLNPNTSTYNALVAYADKLQLNLYCQTKITTVPVVCFFRSSSVAIEYLALGAKPVYLSLNEIVSNNVFELDNRFEFETIAVDEYFNYNLHKILSGNNSRLADGKQIAHYYLDQNFNTSHLTDLLSKSILN